MGTGLIKGIGLAATLVGFGMDFVTGWVDDKKMEEKIDKAVEEKLAEKEKKEKKEES